MAQRTHQVPVSLNELVEQDLKEAVQTGMIVPSNTMLRARFA
jgi:hypothetical protein